MMRMPRRLPSPVAVAHCALLLGLVCTLSSVAAAPTTPAKRPNIVILLADDWGFTDVGAYGSEISTPHLDDLAKQGVKFSNFHASASCSPSRSMLMTGVDNHLNGVGNMRETIPREHMGKPGYLSVLNQNVVTVATLLKDSGYRTYAAGKWHIGKEPHNLPDQRGFDRSIVMGDSGSDNWEPSKRYLDLTDKVYWYEDGKEPVMPKDFYTSEFYVSRAIDYIRSGQGSGKPFFAYVAFQANHIPVQAPRAFIDKYRGAYKDGWTALRRARRDKAAALGLIPADTPMATMNTTLDWNTLTAEERAYQERRMEVYAGMAEAMDYHVGRLIAHLKASGEYDNTVFVFLSDNGAEASDPYAVPLGRVFLDLNYNRDIDRLGSKGAYSIIGPSWGSAAASPLSTYKFYAGEGGIRVPLIIAGVPGMQHNAVQQSFAHINDIAPTLLDLAQVARPGPSYHGRPIEVMLGKSLLPVLRGAAERVHAVGEAIGYELSGNKAVFKGDLKLVSNLKPVGDGIWHLYDISKDPGETQDLKDALPEAFKTMQADYENYAAANDVLPMPDDYEPTHQVLVNAMFNVIMPRMLKYLLILLALGALFFGVRMLWRRRRPA
jgi:arylsulfatase/uncharacterized sulfatase